MALGTAIIFFSPGAQAQTATVDLGTASSFAVLAGSGVSNAGATTITGDVGSSPTATTDGFDTVTLQGTNYGGDSTTLSAKDSLADAYDDAAARTPTIFFDPIYDLGGQTFQSGVYNDSSSFSITGTVTLDGNGDPNSVWIFQMGSTLGTAANSGVLLINGAQASNVFWQVGSSATLGGDTNFVGTIMAATSISLGLGTIVNGRVLAEDGAVSLVSNVITVPEPGSLVLLGLGLIVLMAAPRRYSFRPSSLEG